MSILPASFIQCTNQPGLYWDKPTLSCFIVLSTFSSTFTSVRTVYAVKKCVVDVKSCILANVKECQNSRLFTVVETQTEAQRTIGYTSLLALQDSRVRSTLVPCEFRTCYLLFVAVRPTILNKRCAA